MFKFKQFIQNRIGAQVKKKKAEVEEVNDDLTTGDKWGIVGVLVGIFIMGMATMYYLAPTPKYTLQLDDEGNDDFIVRLFDKGGEMWAYGFHRNGFRDYWQTSVDGDMENNHLYPVNTKYSKFDIVKGMGNVDPNYQGQIEALKKDLETKLLFKEDKKGVMLWESNKANQLEWVRKAMGGK